MIVRLVRLLGLVAVAVSCGGLFSVGYAQALPAQELLNPDGTLNLETGISGCVDISGYQVRLDAERGPVFVPLAAGIAGIGQEGTTTLSGPHTDQEALVPMAVGEAWSPLGLGMNGLVRALAVSNGTLYAGGDFTTAGGVEVDHIAKWDGTSWSALGTGMNHTVCALAVSNVPIPGTLYAGGVFTTAGVVPANRIAKWNATTSTWSALGSGMNGYVYALAVSNGTLYAGGWFSTAGGVTANHIAKWEAGAWSALGSGMDGQVDALAVNNGTLYAGGNFTTAGEVADTKYIAKWDATQSPSWSALGSEMSGSVLALAVSNGTLYAGGLFTTAGGVTANRIAKWDGTSWSALGTGMNNWVYALAVSNVPIPGTLYAGGEFTTAGGVTANYVAKWVEMQWFTLTVTKAGTGAGTVTSSPAEIDCGGTCAAIYTEGTEVTLTATPAADSLFTGWSGDTTGSNPSVTITMNADKDVTATFTLQPYTAGDVNGDSAIDLLDVVLCAQIAQGLVAGTPQQRAAADMDHDGDVDMDDVTMLSDYILATGGGAP